MVFENGMVMMTEKEMNELKREHDNALLEYAGRVALLQKAIFKLTRGRASSEDVRVSKADFIALYHRAVAEMDGCEDNDIYGFDVTVHWHGMFCNCGDGATPANYIIPGVEGCQEEDPTEYWLAED